MGVARTIRWSGTGWFCPLNEAHKGMYWVSDTLNGKIGGYYFCPHSDHSPVHGVRAATRSIWRENDIDELREALDKEAQMQDTSVSGDS